MSALFDPSRHEPLTDAPWDEGAIRRALAEIVDDTLRAARDGLWPVHPLDGERAPSHTLYLGSAGVLWGLDWLARQGAIAADARLRAWMLALPERYAAAPDTGSVVPSYFLGESGVLTVALRAERRKEWEERLLASLDSNVHHPALELLWGAPGTALAAVFQHELTGDERWRSSYLRSAQALLDTWQWHEESGCELWLQDLYGKQLRYLGSAHGFAGNVFALLRGRELLPPLIQRAVQERALEALRATALFDDEGGANWPVFPGSQKSVVQWCHGAPGIISAFARAPQAAELDELLLSGGELTWRAGPLQKGASLCHGSAGSGAACLALFERSGDERWLGRARRLAVHAAQQVAAARQAHGQGRYSLWTGDVGVAVFLWQCLQGGASARGCSGLPSLDF
jgi:hypothetical protein